MALVLLPCDLPTWPTLQRHLNAMKREVRTAVQLKDALLKIYNLCNTSLEPDEESLGDQRVFDVLCDEVVDTWLSDDERHDLFDSQLPTMVDYALQLKTLKPLRGLHFSLQKQSHVGSGVVHVRGVAAVSTPAVSARCTSRWPRRISVIYDDIRFYH